MLKPLVVEYCIVYPVASVTELHESDGLTDTPVALFDGDTNAGADNVSCNVVKLFTDDQLL